MLRNGLGLVILAVVFALAISPPASEAATITREGVNEAGRQIIRIVGHIDDGDVERFADAVEGVQDGIVSLESEGGLVLAGIEIGRMIRMRGLTTVVENGVSCFSACALIWLGGRERHVGRNAEIGFHAAYLQDDEGVREVGVGNALVGRYAGSLGLSDSAVMFLTLAPPDDYLLLTAEAAETFGIRAEFSDSRPLMRGTGAPAHRSPPAASRPQPDRSEQVRRLAVYVGLDLYGADIHSLRSDDIGACALACTSMDHACRAFTFNIEAASRFHDCYLKGPGATPDGNQVAITGMVLQPEDRDAPTFRIGTIDPVHGVMRDIDLPGGDMSSRPSGHTSANACRLACVENDRCQAFTFVESNRQCWLKSNPSRMRQARGMVSGVKQMKTYTPQEVFPID